MLTDEQMLQIAERYIQKKKGDFNKEVLIYTDDIIKKPYGNIYYYNSEEYILTGNFYKSLMGNAPFLVEKKAGRVVQFSTSTILEKEIEAYETGVLGGCSNLYWYPDEDRFSSK
ncbi:hypothetical protein BWK59_10310 [Flavobacterium davisii]|uniref:Immunity protein 35 domain-containing protein n=1 Tax=Flavobacterium davisii TaxID=2906077 RepID=A0A246GIS4_9FLAO|nr:hypothetical protein [Flavobacterium davisii]OWP83469.1 hypothetical protein BWK59_10310 [Flavobacterium davisii]